MSTEASHRVELRLLGPFEMLVDGVPVDESAWGRRKAKTLVKILALESSRERHRDELIEWLWPEADPAAGLNNFHKTLHAARRVFEPDLKAGEVSRYLVTIEQRIALRGPVWIDVHEFDQAIAAEDWARAAELYRGPLLAEDRYEEWATAERDRRQQRFEMALGRLAASAPPERAREYWAKALELNPANETAHRALMRIYAEAGERHLAAQQYRQAVEASKRELDAAPEAATVELYEQILDGEVAATLTPGPVTATPTVTRRSWMPFALGGAAMLAAAFPAYRFFAARPGGRIVDSLAVLPLEAATADLEYLADGATEGIINRLSRLPGLRVMARSTVFTYKSRKADPRAAGRQMGVRAVLTGLVSMAAGTDGKPVVSIELVDVEDGAQIWGQRYSFESGELVSLPSRISTEIAAALQVAMQPDQQRRLERDETRSEGAYRAYLLGRYQWNKRSEAGFRAAIAHFEEAIAQDPRYALAYTGLADAFGLLGFQYVPPKEYLPRARAMVSKALELDPALAEAHTSLGMVRALYDWDFRSAEESFRRAIELNPGYVTAHHWYGVHLNAMGRSAEARAELERAIALDPFSRIILVNRGYPDHYDRQYAAAIRAYQAARHLDPAFPVSHEDLMLAYEQTGQWISALEEAKSAEDPLLQQAAQRHRGPVTATSYRAVLRAWRDALRDQARTRYVSPMLIAQASVRSGDLAGCWEWFEKSLEERSAPLVYLKRDPMYDPIRSDPRFAWLLTQVGL